MRSTAVLGRVCVSIVIGLTLVGGSAHAVQTAPALDAASTAVAAAPDRDRMRMNARVFDRVWSETRSQYYDPALHGVDWNAARRFYRPQAVAAPDDRRLYQVMGRMMALLDDAHAVVLSPALARRQDSAQQPRPVLGLTIRTAEEETGGYRIDRVRSGSPADEAGIVAGWRLLTGEGARWTPDNDVVAGQPLNLDLVDAAGAHRSVVVTPRILEPLPTFVADATRPGVLVLRIDGFDEGLGRWMGRQLHGLAPQTDVVLDLRGNGGGRLYEADAVLSCFLPRGREWATRTVRSGRRVTLRTEGGCGALTEPASNPVAVLVDGQSRSAAELTPAALQEAGRALVVGERTAGAVLIAQDTQLPDGGRLTLSRADFVTSGGVRLEKRGVEPDLLASHDEDRPDGVDPVLEAALAALAANDNDAAARSGMSTPSAL